MSTRRITTSEFEAELEKFASLDRQARMVALAILAHDLTVGIRSALLDMPSPDAVDRLRTLNEHLHQITGRIHASDEHSGREESELLRDIAKEAETNGLKWVVTRRLSAAVRHAAAHRRKRAAATA
jgi:hypothetical protein